MALKKTVAHRQVPANYFKVYKVDPNTLYNQTIARVAFPAVRDVNSALGELSGYLVKK